MKSLAALKREMTTGSVWQCTLLEGAMFPHWAGTTTDTLVRSVVAHQTNGVYLSLPYGKDSFLTFGKSSDWLFDDSDTAILLNTEKQPMIKYELLPF